MTAVVLDTHVLTWVMGVVPKLGKRARRAVDRATASEGAFVSAITPWEISMGVQLGRLRLGKTAEQWVSEALALPGIFVAPLEPEIAIAAAKLPRSFMNDPSDQIIVATAQHLNLPLITADHKILDYSVRGNLHSIDATG